jgi:aspartyl-tRNA(Asn)/glutamyl-tRNA(Gln) amidotransferase subunit B
MKSDTKKASKLAANYMVGELEGIMSKENQKISDIKISEENFAELIGIVADGTINSSAAQTVLNEMYFGDDDDPSRIIDEKNLAQVSDTGELEKSVDAVLEANQESVDDYKAGKENAIKYLMGQVMKETKGKANPQMVMEILKEKLK